MIKLEMSKIKSDKFGQNMCMVYGFPVIVLLLFSILLSILTSLLRRQQAQTLPDEVPPIGKIHPFSKMAVTFEH